VERFPLFYQRPDSVSVKPCGRPLSGRSPRRQGLARAVPGMGRNAIGDAAPENSFEPASTGP